MARRTLADWQQWIHEADVAVAPAMAGRTISGRPLSSWSDLLQGGGISPPPGYEQAAGFGLRSTAPPPAT